MILVLVDFFTGFDSYVTSSASLFHLIHTTFKPWRLEHFLTNSDLLCYFSQWLVTRLHRLELQGLQFYWARLALTCLFSQQSLILLHAKTWTWARFEYSELKYVHLPRSLNQMTWLLYSLLYSSDLDSDLCCWSHWLVTSHSHVCWWQSVHCRCSSVTSHVFAYCCLRFTSSLPPLFFMDLI